MPVSPSRSFKGSIMKSFSLAAPALAAADKKVGDAMEENVKNAWQVVK
jgi:hypothetical protein